ncbi:MAG: hypothetical protein ACOY0T_08915 [Myxococcota bacterium]
MVRFWSLLAGALLLLAGRTARAELPPPGSPDSRPLIPTAAPPAEYPPAGTRGRLALGGVALFGVWYGAAVAQAYAWPDAPGRDRLFIPVAGPWMTVAQAGCSSGESDCTDALAVVRAILAGVSAVGQVGGLAILAESAFMRTEPPAPTLSSQAGVSIRSFSVVTGKSSIGLGVSGAF